MRKFLTLMILPVAFIVLNSSACSSSEKKSESKSDQSSSSSKTTTTGDLSGFVKDPKSGLSFEVMLKTSETKYGEIVVTGNGTTVYIYDADTVDKTDCNGVIESCAVSACVESCAESWPPLEGSPVVANGIELFKLNELDRPDGITQLVYFDHPLYTWEGDKKPGDIKGQGLNGFYLISKDGKKIAS